MQTCIDKYLIITRKVFIPKRIAYVVPALVLKTLGTAIFSAKRLEDEIRDILKEYKLPLNEKMLLRSSTEPRCNV